MKLDTASKIADLLAKQVWTDEDIHQAHILTLTLNKETSDEARHTD